MPDAGAHFASTEREWDAKDNNGPGLHERPYLGKGVFVVLPGSHLYGQHPGGKKVWPSRTESARRSRKQG